MSTFCWNSKEVRNYSSTRLECEGAVCHKVHFFFNFYIKLTKKKMKFRVTEWKLELTLFFKNLFGTRNYTLHTPTHTLSMWFYISMYVFQTSLQHLLHRKLQVFHFYRRGTRSPKQRSKSVVQLKNKSWGLNIGLSSIKTHFLFPKTSCTEEWEAERKRAHPQTLVGATPSPH